jgi:molybdopterin synthase sulfur carrier subunit
LPRITFTRALERFVKASPAAVEGATVGEALTAVFAVQPTLRGYVLDDQGALRRHVAVYVNGAAVRDRTRLSDPLCSDDEVYVFQALSGG